MKRGRGRRGAAQFGFQFDFPVFENEQPLLHPRRACALGDGVDDPLDLPRHLDHFPAFLVELLVSEEILPVYLLMELGNELLHEIGLHQLVLTHEAETFVEPGDIFLVAGETIQRLGNDDVEEAGPSLFQQLLVARTEGCRPANGAIRVSVFRPDIMIVDAWLGEGNGVPAVEELRRTGPVPHVFVTGDISKVPALRRDAVIIQKPYRLPDLVQAVQRALGVAARF